MERTLEIIVWDLVCLRDDSEKRTKTSFKSEVGREEIKSVKSVKSAKSDLEVVVKKKHAMSNYCR